jgi:hypothetical protein
MLCKNKNCIFFAFAGKIMTMKAVIKFLNIKFVVVIAKTGLQKEACETGYFVERSNILL